MTRILPDRPSLEHLKNEAKALLKSHQTADAGCCSALRLLNRFSDSSNAAILAANVTLHEAQLALALDYGFNGWEALRAGVSEPPPAFEAAAAVEQIRQDGYALLPRIYDREMMSEIQTLCARVLERKNRPRCAVPYEMLRRSPLNRPDLRENELVMPIVRALLGDRIKPEWIGFGIRGTAPGGGQTAIQRWQLSAPRFGPSGSLRAVNVSILLTDFVEDNSTLKVWPRSHLIPDRDVDDLKNTEARAAELPSCRLTGSAGSVVIRDVRLWHRELSNPTKEARIVLSRNWLAIED